MWRFAGGARVGWTFDQRLMGAGCVHKRWGVQRIGGGLAAAYAASLWLLRILCGKVES